MDTEGTGLDIYHGCRPYLVTAHVPGLYNRIWEGEVDPSSRKVRWARSELMDLAKFVSSCDNIVFHNANYDIRALASIGIEVTPWCKVPGTPYEAQHFPIIHDTLVASHVVCSGNRKVGHPHGLKELCVKYFGYDNRDEHILQTSILRLRNILDSQGVQIAKVGHPHFPATTESAWEQDMWLDMPLCKIYAVRDVERTMLLYKTLIKQLHNINLYYKYEQRMRLLHCLYRMQTTGINLYVDKAQRVINELSRQIPVLKDKIRTSANIKTDIDPASSHDLRNLLYATLDLPILKVTDTGLPATDEKTLDDLLDMFEGNITIQYLKSWRKATKMRTDIESYIKWAAPPTVDSTIIIEDVPGAGPINLPISYETNFNAKIFEHNRIHSTAHLTGTKWTRQAFSDPNSQNFNKKLKYLFGPPEGYYWLYCDIVNIELRIWAYEVNSKSLIAEFEAGESVHIIIAKALYTEMIENMGVKAFKETKTYTNCKSGTFARIYGGGNKKVEDTYGVVNACAIIDEKCPEIGAYFKQLEITMENNMEIFDYPCMFTIQGYKLDVPVTAPHSVPSARIQGSAGEVIQDMMVKIERFPLYIEHQCQMSNQIHDSLYIQIPCHEDSDTTNKLIMARLEEIGRLHIPTCPLEYEVIEYHGDEEPFFNDYLFTALSSHGYQIEMFMHNKQYLCRATRDKHPTFEHYAADKTQAYMKVLEDLNHYNEVPF